MAIGDALAANIQAYIDQLVTTPQPNNTDEKLDQILATLNQTPNAAPVINSNTKPATVKPDISITTRLPVIGMNTETGKPIIGEDYIKQLIIYALTTAKNELIMRPVLGSHLYKFIGRNISESHILELYAIAANALKFIEHYFSLSHITAQIEDNSIVLEIEGVDKDGNLIRIGVGL